MGSEETATATTGGPQVIGVFDGNGAPSGSGGTASKRTDPMDDD